MNEFEDFLADRERVKRCGTQTTWGDETNPYVIPKREPVNLELVRYLWPELETTK